MGKDVEKPLILNIGCGFRQLLGAVNVDAYDICKPDVVWDLEKTPWPWEDESVDRIVAWHVFEHFHDWLPPFKECARVLKSGGSLSIRVPDSTNTTALAYRDHHHIFSSWTFTETLERKFRGSNAYIQAQDTICLKMIQHLRIPFDRYNRWWFPKSILWWLAQHCVNFIYEQEFVFIKKEPDREEENGKTTKKKN